MKTKLFFLSLAAAALVMAPACNDVKTQMEETGKGTLSIEFKTKVDTKASNADPFADDDEVTTIQAIVFDASGNFYTSITPTLNATSGKYTGDVVVEAGSYNVAVVVNGESVYTASTAATLSALRATGVDLGQNSTSTGTVRYGETVSAVTVAAGSNAVAEITANNIAFRVMVNSLSIDLSSSEASLSITGAFLENIYVNSTYAGTITDFRHPGGRTATGTSPAAAVITSSSAYTPALTYYSGNPASYAAAFYAYPNAVTSDQFDGPIASGVAETRLVLIGSWKQTATSAAETVYYPVTVPSPAAGYSYDINASIAGKGSDDPNKMPENGTLGVSITVNGWSAGAEIPATF